MALQQPIWNPTLPFTGPILGGLSEGKMIIIQGQVRHPVKSFVVNLVCQNGDIAFHFNPRFTEGHVVVCNTQQNGRWGPEQRVRNIPFQPGVYFEMILNVKSHCYQVSVNGSHFLEYSHRLPFHLVQKLFVNGDITVNCINFVGNTPPPYAPPAYNVVTATNVGGMFAQPHFVQTSISKKQKSKKTQGFSGVTLANPAVPFCAAIPGNFTEFRKIAIVGNVPFTANRFPFFSSRFHVNLKNSITGNIALHINPRFKERVLVRNSFLNGAWGPEERHGHGMPFSPGQAFHMEITNFKNNYRVIVNGQVVFDYTHRIPSGQVDQLEIAGDVTLSCVQY
ncbi:galectin-4-like isoform X1 [Anolis sagrei]|uniref:galectin-4-like isoform X1 n=1 Tax=Anolis sagrei TaxID=38937 RepID=UPI0035209593